MSRRGLSGLSSACRYGAPWTTTIRTARRRDEQCRLLRYRCRQTLYGLHTTGTRLVSCTLPRRRPASHDGPEDAHAHPHATKTTTDHPHPPPKRKPLPKKTWILIAAAAAIAAYAITTTLVSPSSHPSSQLNKESFIPCTVVARQQVSSTGFLLTIRLPLANATNRDIIQQAHDYGLWSVEVKQPQLQIARHYTPLPPPLQPPENENYQQQQQDEDKNSSNSNTAELRFFIRRYDTGEVSRYLSTRAPGDTIEIRGPHLGFDLGARLGSNTTTNNNDNNQAVGVCFLAGGTGIAPAMQAARWALGGGQQQQQQQRQRQRQAHVSSVRILWANRASGDCTGCVRVGADDGQQSEGLLSWADSFFSLLGVKKKKTTTSNGADESPDEAEASPQAQQQSCIMAELKALQTHYARAGKTLSIKCAIDHEGTTLTPHDISTAISSPSPFPSHITATTTTTTTTSTKTTTSSCIYHSQHHLQDSTENSDNDDDDDSAAAAGLQTTTTKRRSCTCDAAKNLFIVSGPDGFISSLAGPKVWARGAERQGPVGGVVAALMKKDPEKWRDWLVLKQ